MPAERIVKKAFKNILEKGKGQSGRPRRRWMDMLKIGVAWKLILTEAKDLHGPRSQWRRRTCTYLKTFTGSEE
jgi:peptide subunit release factor 1 (eRF1)